METKTYASHIRDAIQGKTEPLKAVFYGRVSTDNEGQKDSCENQLALCKAFLKEHKNIKLVETFIDEGETATTSYNRQRYNDMLDLISQGEIDLIITKSLHRLHRSEVASFIFEAELINSQTTTFTLEDYQLQDYEDENSMLERSVKYSINAHYSRQQRKAGLNYQITRCSKKELTAKDISLGYKWNKATKTISIDDEKRWIVEYIFEQYTFVQRNPSDILRDLKEKGVSISSATFKNVIQDERYIGNFYINKRTSKRGVGLNAKKQRINLPKEDWVLVERPDLQIIDTELFDLAQRVRANRLTIYEKPDKVDVQARFQGKHLFAGKVFCAECNKVYRFDYGDRANTIPIYKSNSHKDCNNTYTRISEETLIKITKQAIRTSLTNSEKAVSHLKKILESCLKDSDANKEEVKKITKQIKKIQKEIETFSLALCDADVLSNKTVKSNILAKVNDAQKEIDNLEQRKASLETSNINPQIINAKINEISVSLDRLTKVKEISREKVLNHIDKVLIASTGEITVILKTGMNYLFKTNEKSTNYEAITSAGKSASSDGPY